MTDRYKILGQESIDKTDSADLYEVPSAAAVSVGTVEVSPKSASLHVRTLVTSIIVCNTDGVAGSITIKLVSAASKETHLLKGNSIPGNGTKTLSLGLVLSSGEKITGSSHDADYDFTVMGVEILSGGGPSG